MSPLRKLTPMRALPSYEKLQTIVDELKKENKMLLQKLQAKEIELERRSTPLSPNIDSWPSLTVDVAPLSTEDYYEADILSVSERQ